jgi:hypothetical protein
MTFPSQERHGKQVAQVVIGLLLGAHVGQAAVQAAAGEV